MSASCEVLAFQTTQRCHSVFSWRSPLAAFHVRLVAREKVATRLPPLVDRTSGSAPRFPISVALFRLRLTIPPGEEHDCSLHTLSDGTRSGAIKFPPDNKLYR